MNYFSKNPNISHVTKERLSNPEEKSSDMHSPRATTKFYAFMKFFPSPRNKDTRDMLPLMATIHSTNNVRPE